MLLNQVEIKSEIEIKKGPKEAISKVPFYSILRDAEEVTWHFLRSKATEGSEPFSEEPRYE